MLDSNYYTKRGRRTGFATPHKTQDNLFLKKEVASTTIKSAQAITKGKYGINSIHNSVSSSIVLNATVLCS